MNEHFLSTGCGLDSVTDSFNLSWVHNSIRWYAGCITQLDDIENQSMGEVLVEEGI